MLFNQFVSHIKVCILVRFLINEYFSKGNDKIYQLVNTFIYFFTKKINNILSSKSAYYF